MKTSAVMLSMSVAELGLWVVGDIVGKEQYALDTVKILRRIPE